MTLEPLEEALLARYLSKEELSGIRVLLTQERLYCPKEGLCSPSPIGFLNLLLVHLGLRRQCVALQCAGRHFFSWGDQFTIAELPLGEGPIRTVTGHLKDAGQILLLAVGASGALDKIREKTGQLCLQCPQSGRRT